LTLAKKSTRGLRSGTPKKRIGTLKKELVL